MTQTPLPPTGTQNDAFPALEALDRAQLADAILSSALDCIIVADVHGRIVEFNAAAERTFGWSRAEILGRTMDETIVPHHHRAAHRHGMRRYLSGAAPAVIGRRVEVEGLHADGQVFPVELTIVESHVGQGRFFVATLRDVSAQKAAAVELQQARASLQAFFENVPAGIFISRLGARGTDDQIIEFANDQYRRSLPRPEAGQVGADPYHAFENGAGAVFRALDAEIRLTGRAVQREMRNAATGRHENHTRFPILNEAGEITHIAGMQIDIDDRVRAEQALNDARQLSQTLFDNIPAELYLRELDGTFVMMNRWGAEFYGSDPEGMKGRPVGAYDSAEEAEIARQAQEQLLATGAPVMQEYTYSLDGRKVVLSNTIFPVRDAEGRIIRIGGFSSDVTELHNARKEFERAQATLQSFVEQVPVGIHINRLGPGGLDDQTVEFVNENICKPYGLKLDSIVGRNPYAVFSNDLVVQIQRDLDRKIVKTRKPANIEMLNPYSKRHERYTRFPILSPDGTVTHIGGTHVDVDDTVRAKAQLDEVRLLVDSIFDNIPTVLYLRELDGTMRSVNKYGAAIFGMERPEDVIGRIASEFDSPEERRLAEAAQAQLLATGQPVTQEYRRRVGGSEKVVMNTIFPIRDSEGRIVRVGGFANDVTELHDARNKLLEAQNLLQTIFDNVPAELYLRRLDGQYLMANRWALDFYGVSEADLPNLTAETFDTGDGTEVSRQAQRELMATGQPVTREYSHKARGRDVVILNTIFPMRNADGEIDRIGGVSTDITELHNARTQLRRAQDSLHQSEKLAALGQLLAGVAHELNNPLAVVLGRAAILQEKLADTPHAAPLQKLREAANRCARIVKTFLAMARQTGPRRQVVEVNALIEMALEMTTYGLRGSDILWNAATLSTDHRIEADQDQIVQVLINLILNAQHALEGRPIPRKLSITADLSPDQRWLDIVVADNGPGVPDAIEGRIFDPFFTTKAVGQGTGLGLSVCKSMVEAHGGTLQHEATPGGGATFRVTLPAQISQVATPEEDAAPDSGSPTRGRILVVDDEIEIAAILADCLAPLGIDCVIAADGQAALDLLAETAFDAIFCDVSMPGMDGITFYKRLKVTNPLLARHLVFVSGDVLHGDWDRLKASVERPIIEKPFDPQQVREAALLLLDREGRTP